MLIAIYESKNRKSFVYYLTLLISLSAKKSQVLFGIGVSIYSLFNGDYKKSSITFLISILWWNVAQKYSAVSGDYINDRLGYLGSTKLEIINTLLTKPWIVFSESPIDSIFLYTLGLVLPFILLFKLKSIPALISCLPIFLINLISSNGSQRELYSQYSISILPFIVVGCSDSLIIFKDLSVRLRNIYYYLSIFFAIASFIGYSRIGYYHSRYFPKLKESIAFHKVKEAIPANASILTTDNLAPHFANREMVQNIEDNVYYPLDKYEYILLPIPNDNNHTYTTRLQIISTAKKIGMTCITPNSYQILCHSRNSSIEK